MVLGISGYYHDSAAALVEGSEILAAVQEERFTRIKGDAHFPRQAIDFCLRKAGVSLSQLEAIVYYDKPWLTFERILDGFLYAAPQGFEQFEAGLNLWMREKFFLKQILRRELNKIEAGAGRLLKFSDHHLSHAASAYYPSPYSSAAILTIDGVGEWATGTIAHGQGEKITTKLQMNYPHSWGLVYAAFTQFLGFKINSGEYKMMGLAPFATLQDARVQKFRRIILSEILTAHGDGSLSVNLENFEYTRRMRMLDPAKWEKIFGISARIPESRLEIEHACLARAIQSVLEEGVLRMAQTARTTTGEKSLTLAGGVALNCAANGYLRREKIFDSVWVQPAADDAGGALGAALAYSHIALQIPRRLYTPDAMKGSLLGPDYSHDEIASALREHDLPYTAMDAKTQARQVAQALAEGKIVGWFQGRTEWGPRALGNRSILARSDDREMQRKLNVSIKFRETFRPFAPLVLESDFSEIFEGEGLSPYMLFTFPVRETFRTATSADFAGKNISEQLETHRSRFQAVTHMDFSARVQTVNRELHSGLAQLMDEFRALTGQRVLVNTSFNRRGEPIVNTPGEAVTCFLKSGIDCLAIGPFLISKDNQKVKARAPFKQEELPLD